MSPVDLFKMAYSALAERKLRTGLTVLMVVIGAALIMSLNGLNAGTGNFISDQLATLGGNVIIISPSTEAGPFAGPQETPETTLTSHTVRTLSRIRGVLEVAPFIQGAVTLKSGGEEKTVTIVGIDQSKLKYVAPSLELLAGSLVSETDSMGIVLGYNVAYDGEAFFAKRGQTLIVEVTVVETEGQQQKVMTKRKGFQVKGILDELGNMLIDNEVFISLPAANSLLEKGGEYSGIYVISRDPDLNDEVVEDVRDVYGDNIGVTTPKAIAETINQVIGTFNAYIQSIAAISMLVGGVGIVTTLFTSVMERTREIGLLKALGFNSQTILSMFILESGMIGSLGGLIGVLLGIGGAYILTKLTPFGGGMITPFFKPLDMVYVLILSFGLSIIAGLYPSWRASKLSPLEALRKE